MYRLTASFARFIFFFVAKIELKDLHKLPKEGGYIITCSHRGWLEIIALGISLPKPIHFMAKKELFSKKLLASFLTSIKAFPVDRENPSPSSIKTPVKLLRSGEVIGIFPGGTRSSEDAPVKRGAVTIANLSKAPIVPVTYIGPASFKEARKCRKVTITIGDPFIVDTKDKDALQAYSDKLGRAINPV
ncbi:lysophospholipid acyltransferase family protein [Sporosarcina oncorhynchi]|uniref:Lysophospholipid acyltransferase family protein n=1 Tax=Sporosarcina oncorhynchi TaxID=3056444 RepID=A0ABZ0L5X1_9BACL|nr:lysophospholipid acyltransferase family protein [Sporosarcina sp. T2O-4]WOV87878.1 lysophospholipid acyltransferase family protein [Sporosarcina sp. T2O-4]